jgi:hypothetical protein
VACSTASTEAGNATKNTHMKIQTSIKSAVCAAAILFGATAVAKAQFVPSADFTAGLIGQTYTGLEYDYVHRTSGPSRAVHHYAFVSNLPLPELKNTDGAFRYDYTRQSAAGMLSHQHEIAMAFTHFVSQGDLKAFFEGDIGWAWQRFGGDGSQDSFVWRAVAGVEFPVAPRVVLTPYISYKEASQLEENVWNFGAKVTRRLHRDWSGTAGLAFDDDRNVYWSLGLQRRF